MKREQVELVSQFKPKKDHNLYQICVQVEWCAHCVVKPIILLKKKIRYPPWWGERTRPWPASGSQSFSSAGILPSPIPQGKNTELARVNHVHTTSSGLHLGNSSSSPITSADQVGFTGLSDQQWQMLVHLLNERKSAPNNQSPISFY